MDMNEATSLAYKYLLFRYIKMSSPRMNNVIIIGAIAVYIGGILYVLDNHTLTTHHSMCQVSVMKSTKRLAAVHSCCCQTFYFRSDVNR